MKIAFIHYHLQTGGESTVLSQQAEAIRDDCLVLVLTVEAPTSPLLLLHSPTLRTLLRVPILENEGGIK